MLKITGHRVYLTRGDSCILKIGMKNKHTRQIYIPVPGDTLRFALKTKASCGCPNSEEEHTVLTKSIPIETQVLELVPSDTKGLPYGEYWYDIEITFADGRVDTFIADATFELGREADDPEEEPVNEEP